ncbi:MAG TPA: TIM barrel protein [Chthoniobacteraceae bacterium]|jgi:sugar phosphate isomerase/epimerase|nr:TIM barrel protein [Chthoniobacteraceae bacterium]
MRLYFHTIALEPARWSPQRTSHSLVALLPDIAAAGFKRLEIFEPHLTSDKVSEEIRGALQALGLSADILSSYLSLNPTQMTMEQVEAGIETIRARVDYYGFKKIRIFPGSGMNPADKPAIAEFLKRLERVVAGLPEIEILLETHDGSLADDPEVVTGIVRDLNAPNVGLLYQSTFFETDAALRQFEIQRPYIRHLHLQNRDSEKRFATLRDGIVPWRKIVSQLDASVGATLEFVPVGICGPEQFDVAATLLQAQSEAAYFDELAVQRAAGAAVTG